MENTEMIEKAENTEIKDNINISDEENKSPEQEDFAKNILILPMSDKKVEFNDISKADGHMLLRARKLSGGDVSTSIYILAELITIDGEKVTAHDILDLDLEDVSAIEDKYLELKKLLKLTRKK